MKQPIHGTARVLASVCVVAALSGMAAQAMAQAYPNKTVKFIVPDPPGGSTDIVGGRVIIGSISVAGAIGLIKNGRVRGAAVYSPQRSLNLPDVTTVVELGLPGYVAGTFNILVGPASLPAPIVQRLNTALNEAMAKPEVRDRYVQMGMVPMVSTPQQAAELSSREMAKWTKVVKDANISLD